MQNLNLIFGLMSLAGLLVIFPISYKLPLNYKKIGHAVGLSLLHLGIYSLMWTNQDRLLATSLILVEGGLILMWDPFKLFGDQFQKILLTTGQVFFASGLALNLSLLTNFPYWLWILPALLFALPRFVTKLKPYTWLLFSTGIICILVFLGLIGWNLYKKLEPKFSKNLATTQAQSIDDTLSSTQNSQQQTTDTNADVATPNIHTKNTTEIEDKTPKNEGPFSNAIKAADHKLTETITENEALKLKNKQLESELNFLKLSVEKQQQELNKTLEKIESLKKSLDQPPRFD